MAVPVAAQGDPVKSGAGPNLTGRWANVAAVNGVSVDLFAEILHQSTTKTNDFWTNGDDMAFSFKDGIAGETRTATIRWTFLESGTATPVKVAGLSLTIDDLDDGGGRHESLVTSDATAFTLNSPTLVDAANASSTLTLTATGGNDLSPGDPKGAVRIDFDEASSYTITYRTTFSATIASSAYHHDGDGDFAFASPVATSLPPPARRLYYTFSFSNSGNGSGYDASQQLGYQVDQEDEIGYRNKGYRAYNFFDGLPDGLVWDKTYTPFSGPSIPPFEVVYSNGDRDASISNLLVPPGDWSITLRTQPASQGGTFANEATITDVETGSVTATASSSITLESLSTTIVVDADIDTSIAKSAPTWNGYATQLYATADNATPSQTMIYFDLSDDLPPGATIDSAVVYLTSTDPAGTDGAFALHRIMPGVIWKGGASYNWNVAGDGLQTDGAELEASATGQSQLATTIPGVSGSGDRKKWDITDLVQSWVDSPAANNGFAILAASPNREIFCSMEHITATVRPKLVITYSGI